MQKKKFFSLLLLMILAGSVFAQTKKDITVYVQQPVARSDQAVFFKESFEKGLVSSGYTLVKNISESDYNIRLEVRPNMILYDDGVLEQAPPDEKQFVLRLMMVRTRDNREILSFTFLFTNLVEMEYYNIPLINDTMANAPPVKPEVSEPAMEPIPIIIQKMEKTDLWRNKWLYLCFSLEWSPAVFQFDDKRDNFKHTVPGSVFGLELQFLNWMSIEGLAKRAMGGSDYKEVFPDLGLALKFPVKPSEYLMIEPYFEADFCLRNIKNRPEHSQYSVGGGLQFGIKGDPSGVIFFDTSVFYNVANIDAHIKDSKKLLWEYYTIFLGVGYKFGFVDRK